MTDLRTAAQQFVTDYENGDLGDLKHYARALRAALEQPEQEPVAWMDPNRGEVCRAHWLESHAPERDVDRFSCPLYTHPPRREWRGLTEDELTAFGIIHSRYQEESLETGGWFDFARAIEAALKERNA